MTIKGYKHGIDRQVEFAFTVEFGAAMVRKAVESLKRFNGVTGKLNAIEYGDWLRFYTPLCSRGTESVN